MGKYIIRLDDACRQMDYEKWNKLETLFANYDIKPLVGVIPDCSDIDINYDYLEDFWNIVRRWQEKGWTIAQHGLHHSFFEFDKKNKTFQKNIENISEFVGLSYEKQKEMITQGYQIMKDNNCVPTAFFAPAHTFDENTVKIIQESGNYSFISDGYAFHPYIKNNMIFLPSIFDSPHKLFGIQTFVIHPNNLSDDGIRFWQEFVANNHSNIVSATEYLEKTKINKKQGIIGIILEHIIYMMRIIRNVVR